MSDILGDVLRVINSLGPYLEKIEVRPEQYSHIKASACAFETLDLRGANRLLSGVKIERTTRVTYPTFYYSDGSKKILFPKHLGGLVSFPAAS